MINYLGDKNASLQVATSGFLNCNDTDINTLFDDYLIDFISILYYGSYNVQNNVELKFISEALTSNLNYKLNFPFVRHDVFVSDREFRTRMPIRSGEQYGVSGHLPSRRLYDNVFIHFVKLENSVYELQNNGNEIINTFGQKLIAPDRVAKQARTIVTGIDTYYIPADTSSGAAKRYLQRKDDIYVQIPQTPFAAEGATMFAIFITREQLLRKDPWTGVSGSYGAYSRFRQFFRDLGFKNETFIEDILLDPDRTMGAYGSGAYATNPSGYYMEKIFDEIITGFDETTYKEFADSDAKTEEAIRWSVTYRILEEYNKFKKDYFNELANCIYRKFGWTGETFDGRFIAKGNGTISNGLLNIRAAGITLANYSFIKKSSSITVNPDHEFTFNLTYKGEKFIHWSAWGFDENSKISDLSFDRPGDDDRPFELRAKHPKAMAKRFDSDTFYPRLVLKGAPGGMTGFARYLAKKDSLNHTFQWKNKWPLFKPREERLIATYSAYNQTLALESDQTGITTVNLGGLGSDEIFAIFIAFTTDENPPTIITTTTITTTTITTIEVNSSFKLDLDETFRDDHFVLTETVRDSLWQTQQEIEDIDSVIDAMRDNCNSATTACFNYRSIVTGHSMGVRPKKFVTNEIYKKNDRLIVEELAGVAHIYRLAADSFVGGASFDQGEDWITEISYYDPTKSYKRGDKVVYADSPSSLYDYDIHVALVDMAPQTFDRMLWQRQPIVDTDPEQEHYPPNLIASRSVALKQHHALLRYAFLNVRLVNDEMIFTADAWVSQIRSRLDRMYRNYDLIDLVNDPAIPPLLDLEDRINTLTGFDSSKTALLTTPQAGDPVFPNKEGVYIDPVNGNITYDARTYAPTMNNDYPHDGSIPNSTNSVGYTPGGEWIPIYNPLLSCLRAMTILEEGINAIIKRAIEREGLPTPTITAVQRECIEDALTKMKDDAFFEVWTAEGGDEGHEMVGFEEFENLKIQPTCREALPGSTNPAATPYPLSLPDFTNSNPNWKHGFNDDSSDSCAPVY